jgi:hypothetical protein
MNKTIGRVFYGSRITSIYKNLESERVLETPLVSTTSLYHNVIHKGAEQNLKNQSVLEVQECLYT